MADTPRDAAGEFTDYPRPPDAPHATPDVFAYLFVISFLYLLPGQLVYTPIQTLYKDQLHMSSDQTAIFKLVINVPGMLAFIFGICRDRYNLLKMGDRGILLVFGILAGLTLFVISRMPLSIASLGVGLFLWGIPLGMLGAAFQALTRNIAEARMMTGRMSTLLWLLTSVMGSVAYYEGGQITDRFPWRTQLVMMSFAYLAIAASGLWKPNRVLADLPEGGERTLVQFKSDVRLLFQNRAYWVAVGMWGLWQFSPAGATPMFYYCKDVLKMTGAQFGTYLGIQLAAGIPTVVLFGILCKRVQLWPVLLIGTVIAIPQWMPVLWVKTPMQVYIGGAFVGMTGGLATAAYYDVLYRACPRALAGSGMLVATGLALVVIEVGNVAGGFMYKLWGFGPCAYATTFAYALLLPLCFLLPKAIVSPKDDEHVPTEAELLAA